MQPELLLPEHANVMAEVDALATRWPWSLNQYQQSFTDDYLAWGFFAESSTRTILNAFGVYQKVLDESTLMNLVVHPDVQRQGLAFELLKETLLILEKTHGVKRCLLEVRESNTPAIRLYEKLGFSVDGLRKNYYPAVNGRETALLMSRHL